MSLCVHTPCGSLSSSTCISRFSLLLTKHQRFGGLLQQARGVAVARQATNRSVYSTCPRLVLSQQQQQQQQNHTRHFSSTSPTMTLETISTGAKTIAPYSQAIKANGQIWVSGQVPADPNTGKLIEGSITDMTAQCCKNVKEILDAAGSSMEKVCRVGVFLVDMKDFAEMNAEYAKWFTHRPARACVAVHQLPMGATVEIEVIALA